MQALMLKARKVPRSRCRIETKVRYFNEQTDGRVLNLSGSGLALELSRPLSARAGAKIWVESPELGLIDGTVQWCQGTRLGLQFDRSSNAWAKVASYFRFYHRKSSGSARAP